MEVAFSAISAGRLFYAQRSQHGSFKKMTSPKHTRPPPPRRKMQRVADSGESPAQQHTTTEPIRFLGKAEVAALCNVTFVTIWKWMQRGVFPKGKEVGGKTCWRSDEIAEWQNKRPDAHVKKA